MILETSDVSLRYGEHSVLESVELAVPQGARLVLVGANGSGKTTLLRALCGSHRPSSGQILMGGEPLTFDRRGLRAHRRRVQLVLQDPDDQLFSADVRQDVSFGPTNLGLAPAEVLARVDETLEFLSITHLADRPCHHLSYGERKRVALAGAMAMRPEVLLLDEPTAGLDPAGVEEILATMQRLQLEGATLVLSTHELDLALALADIVGVVVDGGVVVGDPSTLLGDEELLARARLRRPWPLELAARLELPGSPRTLDDIVKLLR